MFDPVLTPCLVLDKDRLQKNTDHFLGLAQQSGILFRPHLKTCKSADVARIGTGGRMNSVTVSTLKEAEYFARVGFSDIMCAAGITPNKFDYVRRISQQHGQNILLITDNIPVARAAVAFAQAENCRLNFLIELDCGEHRGGLAPDSPELLEIARLFQQSGSIQFRGVMTHAGHSYGSDDPERIGEIAEVERKTVVDAARELAQAGITCDIISVGSTPTFLHAKSFEGLTEVRAGVFMFFDLAQYSRNICGFDDIAISVLATVIGHNRPNSSITVDAGAFALSKDFSANTFLPDAGYGYVCDPHTLDRLGALSIDTVHQEHGTIQLDDAAWFERLPIGSLVRILPNHACPTAAAHSHYLVVENGEQVGEWPRVNGW